jgi:hypothetical protein
MQKLGSCVSIEYLPWIIKEILTGFVLDFHLDVCIKITAERLPTYFHGSHFFVTESRISAFFIIRKFIAMFIKAHHCSSLILVLKGHLLLSSYRNLVFPRNVFRSGYLTKVFCAFLLSPKRNTWTHLIFVDLIVSVTFGEKHKKIQIFILHIVTKLPLISKYLFKYPLLNYVRYKLLLWDERRDIALYKPKDKTRFNKFVTVRLQLAEA